MGRRKKSDIAVELQQSLEYDDGSVVKKEVIDKSTLKAPINMWKPKSKYDLYITPDVQECTIEFDRLFGVAKLSCYNKFAVKKDSYSNQLPTICKYINFFIHEYDTEKELIMIYLNIKASIDNIEEKLPIGTGDYFEGEQDYDKFIDYVYEMMFTELPAEIAVNEAIELIKRYDGEESASFANGVLGGVDKALKEQA